MKAWWAAETDDWGFYVHGETASQAKARAHRCEPSDFWEYLEIQVRRVPEMDGQPFTFERLVAAGFAVTEEDGEPASADDYANFCDCALCAAAAQKALILNERPCEECAQFKLDSPALFSGEMGICHKKLMGVTRTMRASCLVGESCFEPVVAEDNVDE